MTNAHGPETGPPQWVPEVLRFWFSELDETRWFVKDGGLDDRIRKRFLPVHQQLVGNEGQGLAGPRQLLAAVIVLDQFSRNLFRGSSRAFAADPLARRLARRVLTRGHDTQMRKDERYFLYLPFEHSEVATDQALAVELISRLEDEQWTQYALAHKAIIDRFGRFPHRNIALGRTSTAEEIAALQGPMGAF